MLNIRDKEARNEIQSLTKDVNELRRDRLIGDNAADWGYRKLTAQEIIDRFNELYAHLGVERVGPTEPKLIKTKKEKKQ